jgi:uncharacterized protein (DUF169 family)
MKSVDYSVKLGGLLGLETPALGVKCVQPGEPISDVWSSERKARFCQSLMLARKGETVKLTAENITCPAAASAFGLKRLPEKLKSGEMMFGMGLFNNPEAAAQTVSLMPRLDQGRFSGVLIGPLDKFDTLPDVVVIEAEPEKLMWVALADISETGGRHSIETGVFQATCVDTAAVPFVEHRLSFSLGCYGCRDATDITLNETVLGYLASSLGHIIDALEKLAQKAMPRSRSKAALRTLTGCRTEAA